jgi:hypothetical protein
MTTPGQHDNLDERLDELEANIERARRQAEEHGTIPSSEPQQTFIDPDGDGRIDDADEDPNATFGG